MKNCTLLLVTFPTGHSDGIKHWRWALETLLNHWLYLENTRTKTELLPHFFGLFICGRICIKQRVRFSSGFCHVSLEEITRRISNPTLAKKLLASKKSELASPICLQLPLKRLKCAFHSGWFGPKIVKRRPSLEIQLTGCPPTSQRQPLTKVLSEACQVKLRSTGRLCIVNSTTPL